MKLLVPAALRSYTGATRLDAPLGPGAATLAALFDELDRRHPGLRFRVVDERGQLRPHLRIFVNGLGVRDLDHPLHDDDDVALVLALSGG